MKLPFALVLLAMVQIPQPANAQQRRSPGPARVLKQTVVSTTYRDWHDVDEVTIIHSFDASSFRNIAVESFDTSGLKLPDANDNTRRAVESALGMIKPAFIEGLKRKAQRKRMDNGLDKTLIVRARLIKVDPGSQAARYWIGYGAGAVKIAIVGEIIDGSSQKTLVRFAQERRSGFGMFGGGYGELFARTARQLGGDVAGLINAF
jgi:hypothetical protein